MSLYKPKTVYAASEQVEKFKYIGIVFTSDGG